MNPFYKRIFALFGVSAALVLALSACKVVGGVECSPATQSCHVDVTRVTQPGETSTKPTRPGPGTTTPMTPTAVTPTPTYPPSTTPLFPPQGG